MVHHCAEVTALACIPRFSASPAFVIFAVLMLFFFVPHVLNGATFCHYRKIKVENAKIEDCYRDWLERSRKNQHFIETSLHDKVSRWRRYIRAVHFTDEMMGLQLLNTLVNENVVYLDDYAHFRVQDYWAEPYIVLEEGGDCEDIALLKAASLWHLNWPAERMQLLVGYLLEQGRKKSHAVLLVETTAGEQLILSSNTNDVVPLNEFSFLPIYAVNGNGVFVVKLDTSTGISR